MSPPADDAAFAQRFLDDLIERVRDVPSLKSDVSNLKHKAERWERDHDKIVEGTLMAKMVRYAGTIIQGIIALGLIPTLMLLVDLRDSRIASERDIKEIRQTIVDQTFAPADWGRMQQTVADLVDSNDRTVDAVNALSKRTDELATAIAKAKPTRVEVHPTNTIIIPKPDQSRANKPFGEPSIPRVGPH